MERKCPCGQIARPAQRDCKACHAKYQKTYRARAKADLERAREIIAQYEAQQQANGVEA